MKLLSVMKRSGGRGRSRYLYKHTLVERLLRSGGVKWLVTRGAVKGGRTLWTLRQLC